MKKRDKILLGLAVVATIGLVIFGIYNIITFEKYKKLSQIGYFPIDFSVKKRASPEDEYHHKYDGHRYKQKRRYNFLSQQNRRSYEE
jgi:hypothetical protein